MNKKLIIGVIFIVIIIVLFMFLNGYNDKKITEKYQQMVDEESQKNSSTVLEKSFNGEKVESEEVSNNMNTVDSVYEIEKMEEMNILEDVSSIEE